jgi:hypothetical protein
MQFTKRTNSPIGSKTPELSSYSERVDRHRTNLPARSYSERGFSDRIEPRRNLPPQNLSQRFDSLLSNSHNVFSSSIDRRSEASRRFNPSSVRQQVSSFDTVIGSEC